MRDLSCIEPSSFLVGQKTLRMLSRDAQNPALPSCVLAGDSGADSCEPNFFDATRKYGFADATRSSR
jgi:hypothetical protein